MQDPSEGYRDALMASKQRPLVEEQLAAMHDGKPTKQFAVLGEAMAWLKGRSNLKTVSLLDAGCASAYYWEVIDHFVPGWVRYTGLDYNPQAIQMGRSLYPDVELYIGDVVRMRFWDKQFDIVFTAATVNHVLAWRLALREATRVCAHWLILHRLPLHDAPTSLEKAKAYDRDVWRLIFKEEELNRLLAECEMAKIWDEPFEDLRIQIWERCKT